MSLHYSIFSQFLILQVFLAFSSAIRQDNAKRGKSLSYPLDVCKDSRYWKPLPNPEGVIGFGYNAMTGRLTTLPLFNVSIFDEFECRLAGRRSVNGTWDMYRLPSYVTTYTFHDESMKSNLKLDFQYTVYNSTLDALLDVRKSRSLPFEANETTRYEDLYFHLDSAPIRFYAGARIFYEAMDDLASNSWHGQNQESDKAASILYSLRSNAITGEFQLKSKEKLSWIHLSEKFRLRLRRAIMDDDFLGSGFFDQAGTHYAVEGTFGGVSERWWISRRRPERKCDEGEKSKILDASLIAACDRFRVAGFDEIQANGFVEMGNSTKDLTERCSLVYDNERFRPSRWMVTSGGPVDRLKAAHVQQAAFSGRSDNGHLQKWLSSLNDEPSTVRVQLAPICDLLSLVDQRPWHLDRCKEHLLSYVLSKDPFYSGKSTKPCPNLEVQLKFERSATVESQNASVKLRDRRNLENSFYGHCVSTGKYSPERSCKTANGANTILSLYALMYVSIALSIDYASLLFWLGF